MRHRAKLGVALPVIQPVVAQLDGDEMGLERRIQKRERDWIAAAAPHTNSVELLRLRCRPRDGRRNAEAEEAPVLASSAWVSGEQRRVVTLELPHGGLTEFLIGIH